MDVEDANFLVTSVRWGSEHRNMLSCLRDDELSVKIWSTGDKTVRRYMALLQPSEHRRTSRPSRRSV